MRFVCDRCGMKYSIPDERVRGKVLKVRCKGCSNIITVRGAPVAATVAPAPASVPAPRATFEPMPNAEWYLGVNDQQLGPFSTDEVDGKLRRGELPLDTFIWTEGLGDWHPMASIEHFSEANRTIRYWDQVTTSPMPRAEPPSRVFVSYRRDDEPHATRRIVEALAKQFGPDSVFQDIDSIPLGANFRKHITQALENSAALLAVIGRHWIDARDDEGLRRLEHPEDPLRIEIETALRLKLPVIPVFVLPAKAPRRQDLPQSLRDLPDLNGVTIRVEPHFAADVGRLIAGIVKLLPSRA